MHLPTEGSKFQLEHAIRKTWKERGSIHWGAKTTNQDREGGENGEKEEDEDATCKICYDCESNMIIIPCRHSLCGTCALNTIQTRRRTCPFCNQDMLRIWPTNLERIPRAASNLAASARASLALSQPTPSSTQQTSSPSPPSPSRSLSHSSPSASSSSQPPSEDPSQEEDDLTSRSSLAVEGSPSQRPSARFLGMGFHFESPPPSEPVPTPTQPLFLSSNIFTATTTTTTTTTNTTTTSAPRDPASSMWEISADGEFREVSFRPLQRRGQRKPTKTATPLNNERKAQDESSLLEAALSELTLSPKQT